MTCDARLEPMLALLDGTLAHAERAVLLAHLEGCADCRGLFGALGAAHEAAEDPGLAGAILERTSGAACGSASSRLCAWADGELDALDAELVEGHLGSCSECAALARTVARLNVELPRLAAADPGPRFVEGVLARTSRRRTRQPWRAWIASAWTGLVDRPRVAWEGAFVATLLFVAPVLAHGSALADLPSRGLQLVRSPEQRMALGNLRVTANDLESALSGGARAAWATTGGAVVDDSIAMASSFARQSESTWETIREQVGTFPGSAASGQKRDGTRATDREPDATQEKSR